MKSMDKLKDMICTNLEEYSKKNQLSTADLDAVNKLIIAKEKLLRIEEIEQNMGYSQNGGWRAEGMYARNSYGNGNAYSRGDYMNNNSMSNDYSYGMNSYNDGQSMMMQSLQSKLEDPNTAESDKNTIRRAMYLIGR